MHRTSPESCVGREKHDASARQTARMRGFLHVGSAHLVPGVHHTPSPAHQASSRDAGVQQQIDHCCLIARSRHCTHKQRARAQGRRAAAASCRGGISSMCAATSEQPAVDGDVGEDRRHDKLQACHTGKRGRAGGFQGHRVEGRRERSRGAARRSHRASGGGNAPLPPHGHRLGEDVVVEVRPCHAD